MLNAPPPPPTATTTAGGTLQGWSMSQDQSGSGYGAETTPPPPVPASPVPAPGALRIKERRSWQTWQLGVAVLAAAVIGMLIGNAFAGGGTSAATSDTAGHTTGTLPAEGAGSTTGASTPGATGAAGTTATTAPPSSATTAPATAAGSSSATTAPAPTGPLVVLLGPHQAAGTWTSTPFTVAAGTWNIGWAFRCTPAPASGPSLQIFVVPSGGSPGSTPAVTEIGASGQSVTTQTASGTEDLVVKAPATCEWAVKVTGQQ
ncbi:MAG: hypothetical protein ABSG81_12535 [Acidimicrobiales bacterium]